jgi:hypothetical protein
MATNLDRLRNIQVSADSKESTYDTAVAVDSKILINAGVIPDDQVEVVNDQDLIGGTEEAGSSTLIAQSLTFPMAQNRVKPHTLAFIGAYALGSVATTTPGGGTTARKHTITPATSATMNSFTMEGLLKTGLQNKWSGCMVDSFDLSFQRGSNRFCNIAANVLGSGTVAAGTATESEVSEAGLNAATAAVWLDATTYDGSMTEALDLTVNDLTSNPAVLGADVIGFEWNYRNNIDPDFLYTIGSGNQFGIAERVARDQTVTLTLLWQDEGYRTQLLADTDMALQLKVKNAEIASESLFYGYQIMFPKLRIASRPKTEQGGRMVETITFNVLEDATHGSVILEVFNVQTAYMA